jgi:hypothetical protein
MSDELLDEASRALRDTEPASEFEARATRTRVLTGLHQTRVRRRTRLAFLLPIAASFVAVSAWGAASGQARVVLHELERLVGVTPSPAGRAKAAAPRRLTAPPILSVAGPEPAAPAPSPEAATLPGKLLAIQAASAERVTSSPSSLPGRAERADPNLALYRVAHTAHFVDRDPARALAAWDVYLRAAPNGEFAPEARYNRALSLVRLGRGQEAQSALEPFANGAYGGYRKAEASALLQHLKP